MNEPFDIALTSWSLGVHNPVLRHPYRRPALRHVSFEDKYDFHAVFYDCFWSNDGKSLRLIGPPLQNLADSLGMRFFAMPSGKELTPSFTQRAFATSMSLPAPRTLQYLRIESAAGTAFLVPQPNLSSLFAGRRVLMTLSQNNELEWIRDWVIYHQRLHGCDAVLVYDNKSTRYDISELKGCLATIPGITGLALDWPFRYGPFDGRLPLTYDLWEGHFCQFGMLEHARFRFLPEARCALNLDIDELVVCPAGESICALTEASPTGHLKFAGQWVEPFRTSGPDTAMPLHRQFRHCKAGRTQGCENKYAVVPSRVPDSAQFGVHDIFGHVESELPEGVELRHFKALNTNWTVDRPGSLLNRTDSSNGHSELVEDAVLGAMLDRAFDSVPAAFVPPSPKDAETAAYQSRTRSARLLRSGRLPEAEAAARAAIAEAPQFPSLHLHLAEILDLLGNTEAAQTVRNKAERLRDADGASHHERARYLLHQGEQAAAARLLRRAIRTEPGFAAAYLVLGQLFRATGRRRAAEHVLGRGLARTAASALLHAELAEVLASDDRSREALEHIDRALAAEPDTVRFLLLRSQLLRALDRPRDALDATERALQQQANNPAIIRQLAAAIDHPFDCAYPDGDAMMAELEHIRCLLQLKELAAATLQSIAMLKEFPNRPHAHEARYIVLEAIGRPTEARSHLMEAIRLARRDLDRLPPQTLGRYVERAWHEGRLSHLRFLLACAERDQEADELLADELKHYPESHGVALQLAYLLVSRGAAEEAGQHIADALKRFPRDPLLWTEMGRLREAAGDEQGAIEAFRRAIRLGSGQVWLASHLAQLLAKAPGNESEATSLLQGALSRDDSHAISHYRLGELQWRNDQRAEALESWRTAARLAPDEAWLWSHLGGSLVDAGDVAEAEVALARAESLNPDDMLTQFRLGRLHASRGEMEQAVARFERAVTLDSGKAWLWRDFSDLLIRAGQAESAAHAAEQAATLEQQHRG